MDENDDKLLAAYDLTAWEAPPAPAGMVDRIVERAHMPAAPPMRTAWKWKRAAVIAGSAVAALAAVLAFVVFGTERAPQNGGGLVRATNAQRLDLGTSFATLDAGTELHWQRRGTHVDVVQLEGGAVWNVSPNDTIVIETGSPGATVASVEATGASLRTEVQMLNRTDARVIGLGSAVAALVSITTVVVYEGHVKATSNGQVVSIQSGSMAQFPPSAPGSQPPSSQYTVGAGPTNPAACDDVGLLVVADKLHQDGKHIDALIDLLQSYACKPSSGAAVRVAVEACHSHDENHAVQYFELAEVSAHAEIDSECRKAGIDIAALIHADDESPATCDTKTLNKKGEDFLSNGMDTAALNQFQKSLACKDDPTVKKMAYITACRLKNLDKAAAYFTELGEADALKQVCLRFGIDPSKAPPSQIDNTINKHGPVESACDEVSCVLNNYDGACCQKWKKRADEKKQDTCDEVSCVLNNYGGACCTKYKKTAATPPEPTCDANGPKQKGEDFMNKGMDTQALALFELSLKCKNDTQTMKMAYISACRLKNGTKAKAYFKSLGSQASLIQVCMRFGLDPSL